MAEDEDLLGVIPDDEDVEDEEILPSKTYKIDFENNRIIGNVDEDEAVKQAIAKVLLTPRFKNIIYDDDYGSEIEDEIRDAPSDDYIVSVIPDLVKDALLPDERILDVGDFTVDVQQDSLFVTFTAYTIYGDIEIEEVV